MVVLRRVTRQLLSDELKVNGYFDLVLLLHQTLWRMYRVGHHSFAKADWLLMHGHNLWWPIF